MNVEEEVILWVTSDLCSSSTATSVDDSVSTTAIPVALISRTDDDPNQTQMDTLEFEDVKEDEFCITEEDSSVPSEKKSRRRGVVWNYFIPTLPDRAQCAFCSVQISYKGKSTNNLLRHLRTKHAETLKIKQIEKITNCTTEDGSTYYVLSTAAEQPPSPALSTSSFHEDTQIAVKKRGGVWKFFRADCTRKRAKCRLCTTVISFKGGSTTNLLRHMKYKHEGVKVPHKLVKPDNGFKTVSSIQRSLAKIVNECIKSDDEVEFQPVENLDFGASNCKEIVGIENIETFSSEPQNSSQNSESLNENSETCRERRKSAIAWKYFAMEGDERAKCKTCDVCISFKGGSTGNLLRHLKTKHSEIDLTPPVKKEEVELEEVKEDVLETIENEELAKFVQLLNPKYKLRGTSVPRFNEKEIPKRLRKRGAALSFFDMTSNDCGTCQLCGVAVSVRNGSKAIFLRHLKAKHPQIDSLLVTSNTNSEATIVEQKLNVENIENIPIELNIDNSLKDKTGRKMRKRGLVWNHFAPLEDEKAKCIVCPAVISYKRGSTSNLLRHMKKKHPEIDVRDETILKIELADPCSSEEDEDDAEMNTVDGRPRKILRKRGRVWNHFKPVSKDKAKCGVCQAVVVYPKGSTTNLLRHMKKRHPKIDLSKEKPFNKRITLPRDEPRRMVTRSATIDRLASMDWDFSSPDDLPPSSTPIKSPTGSSAIATTTTTAVTSPASDASANIGGEKVNAIHKRSEIIFRKHFDKFLNRPVSVTKSKQLDEQLAKMIVKQYCPFTIVESDEFRKFVQTVNPGYSLPSRKTISSRLIPEVYEKCVVEVRERLRNVQHVAVATNGWTLSTNECYISITAHFIDDECTFQSFLLGCFRYDEEQSAEKLFEEMKTILDDWDLIEKVAAVVSDNAANITAAIRLRSWRHIPCFANMLNLVVQAGLLEMRAVHEKVRIIVDHLKKNPLTAKKLAAAQKEAELPEAKPKPDDPQRWSTTYDMFRETVACRPALVTLDSYVETLPMLEEREWLLLERTCAALKPFLDVIDEVGEKNVTVSKVIPLSRCIGNYVKKMLSTNDQLPTELAMVLNKMLDEITSRFSDVEDNALLAEATFLDPRFKNQAFVDEQAYANVYHAILQQASEVVKHEKDEDATSTSAATADIWAEFDSRVHQLSGGGGGDGGGAGDFRQSAELAAAGEIESYLQETLLGRGCDPLVWWRERRSVYPRLYDIMRQRLCIAATAVTKRFSDGGQLVCEKRNKLSSSKVSMVLFLNHNLQ